MTLGNKLKTLRKQTHMSQEKLAEKLNVSRQAITKWETDTGIPSIENLIAISTLFNISLDDFLLKDSSIKKQSDFLYESITEYDIDEIKHYDMNFGGAKQLVLSGYDGEKIRIYLASNQLATLQNDFKIKLDDTKRRIDIDLKRKGNIMESLAKETLMIFVQLPIHYVGKIELKINAESVKVTSLKLDHIELDLKTKYLTLENVIGNVEINCNLDMTIYCNTLNGEIAINQLSATSKLYVPYDTIFAVVKKGIGTSISYEKDNQQVDNFSSIDTDNIIELNGFKSELIICSLKK